MYEDYDDYEYLPKLSKISPATCLGRRVSRPLCSCCGGSWGIRKPWRKVSRHHNTFRYRDDPSPKVKKSLDVHLLPKAYKPKLKKNDRETIRYE